MIQLRTLFALAAVSGLTALPLIPPGAAAQRVADFEPPPARASSFDLTIRSIMRGPELIGEAPQGVSWTDDSEWVYFRWRPGGLPWDEGRSLYRVRPGSEPERIEEDDEEAHAVLYADGDLSPDRRWRASQVRGDIFLVDRESMAVRQLTRTRATESSPHFSGDGSSVFFREGNDLFSIDLETGAVVQLTDIRSGSERPDEEAEGQKGFLERQQTELFEHVRTRNRRQEEDEAARERREALGPQPAYLGPAERVTSLTASPDGGAIAVTAQIPVEATNTPVPAWVTESGYTEELNTRSKVGDAQTKPRLGVVDPATGALTWLDLVPDPEGAEGAEGDAAEEEDAPEGHGELTAASFLGWNDAGTLGLAVAIDYDYKTWRLYAFSADGSDVTLLDQHHDPAWVGGPCFDFGGLACAGWIPGQDRVYYVSEETGYAHAYTVAADGTDQRALTSGEWEVTGLEVTDDRSRFLMHTSERSPFDMNAYSMGFDGSDRRAWTDADGSFALVPSPDGSRFAVVHSVSNRPPELYLMEADHGAELERVTHSPTEEWLAFDWIQPEIVRVPAEDGTSVPARIYRPADVGGQPNGAGVVFVHGAGYLHNVHNWWSSYYREYMFHHLLAAQGYTVLDIDFRGSAGYGRDWRTAVYRWMGGKDLSDQVDGARYLVANEGVDADRIGLYGGSYGGFITLMALFTAPDVFAAGAALRSVTDWAHYNHWYTQRILNLPQEDEEAYRQSSPIYFAEGLEGHLLMAHGMVDTNVHFSDVVRLAQRLIELGKENWEMAVYPVENHGFQEPTSWTDEYRRIFELFERTIGTRAGTASAGGR